MLELPRGCYPLLLLSDSQLQAQCTVSAHTASGPGGQKRNRSNSAIRIAHPPTGLTAVATESRLQGENRSRALRRLRLKLALQVRPADELQDPPPLLGDALRAGGLPRLNPRNPLFPLACAFVLDHIWFAHGRIADAATAMGVSTGQLNRFASADADLFAAMQEIRRHYRLPLLRR